MALLKTFPLDPDTGYGFEWLRAILETAGLQEGVLNAGDLKVTPAAAGGQRVDVAAGWALIKGDSGLAALGLTQGLYLQGNDAAVANALTLAAGGANPRIDQIVLTVNDTSDLGSASNVPTFAVVQGAESAGTTLDTRAGAAALPANSIRLADVLVPAGSSAVTAPNVRDRRPWARGAHVIRERTAGNLTVTSTAFLALSTADFQRRVECSGAPMRARLLGRAQHINASQWTGFSLRVDGAPVNVFLASVAGANGNTAPVLFDYEWQPAAGSHLIEPFWRSSDGGVATLFGVAASEGSSQGPMAFVIDELVRQNADNT